MSNEINTGGPAFPWCGDLNECPTINLGMNLRDYFAAKAMQGLLASGEANKILEESDQYWPQAIADDSYAVADAMIKARTE